MKLTYFIHRCISSGSLELPAKLSKKEFPFPISNSEYQEYFEHPYNCYVQQLFQEYCEENGFSQESREIEDYDLEKGCIEVEIVFSFQGKYYRYWYWESPYEDYCPLLEEDAEELEEVEPYTETITITKWKKIDT